MKIFRIRVRFLKGRHIVGFVADKSATEFKPADILPWSALFISLISLGYTIFQGRQAIIHDRLSVIPHIFISRFGHTMPDFGILAENDGAGLAIIKDVDITYRGSKLSSVLELRKKLISEVQYNQGKLSYSEINVGNYYSPNQRRDILKGDASITSDIKEKLWPIISSGELEIRINYCSVYNDCNASCMIANTKTCGSHVDPL